MYLQAIVRCLHKSVVGSCLFSSLLFSKEAVVGVQSRCVFNVIFAIPISLYIVICHSCVLSLPPSTCAGYAFLLFREEVSVHRLVKSCLTEEGKLYMFVSSLTQNNKKVNLSLIQLHV